MFEKVQTSPLIAVSEDQYQKFLQFLRDCVHKRKIDRDVFQYILDHEQLSPKLDAIFSDIIGEYRIHKSLTERVPFVTVPAKWYEEYNSAEKLENVSIEVGIKIGDWGGDLVRRLLVSGVIPEREVNFIDASNAELGYPDGCSVEETYKTGIKFGLELCRPEDGPLVRVAYQDQRLGDWRLMAMKPIVGFSGCPGVFEIGNDRNDLCLFASHGFPALIYKGSTRWVFRRNNS